jgi:hypothetical protein
MRLLIPMLVAGLVLGLAAPALSQSILVWDKDHDKLFADPEGVANVDATYGIKKALDALGYTYDVTTSPTPDLSSYNILFVIMGVYC